MHLSWKVAFLTYEHKCTVCMSCVLIKKGFQWSVSSFFPFFFCIPIFSDFHGFYWKEKYLMASDYFTIWLFVLLIHADFPQVIADPNERILVMGATNRPNELDDAALRCCTSWRFLLNWLVIICTYIYTNNVVQWI